MKLGYFKAGEEALECGVGVFAPCTSFFLLVLEVDWQTDV
jgi:hypothetical protein